MKTTIAVPLGTGSVWEDNNELRYMLRSLDENLHIDYDVKLYARRVPPWIDTSQVDYKIVEKYYPRKAKEYFGDPHFESYFDTLNKLYLMAHDEKVSEKFVYMYDDVLLLKPIHSFADLNKKVALRSYEDAKKNYDRRGNKWTKTTMKAFDYAKERARPMYDYETHLPRCFDKELLRRMFELYPIEEHIVPYAPSTLYYNLFYNVPDTKLILNKNIKAGFYGERHGNIASYPNRDKEGIDLVVRGKTWLNYNNKGLRHSELKEWIDSRFSEPSKFEMF